MTKPWTELIGELPKRRSQATGKTMEALSNHASASGVKDGKRRPTKPLEVMSAKTTTATLAKTETETGTETGTETEIKPATTGASDRFKREVLTNLDSMYRMAMSLTRNVRDAEDLTQEAALKALGHPDQYRMGTNMRAWLLTIVRNAYINRYRSRRKQPASVQFEEAEPYLANTHATDDASARVLSVRNVEQLDQMKETLDDEIKRALDDLSEGFRETFLLAVVEGLSYKDIAEILSIPVGTVMSRLFRARRQMLEKLETFAKQKGWLPIGKTPTDKLTVEMN